MRAQANLVALAVALLVLSATVTAGVAIADGAYANAERDPVDRGRAVALADALVAADSPLALRDHVLSAARVANASVSSLHAAVPASRDWGVRLVLDGDPLLTAGTPAGGVTARRTVLLGARQPATVEPRLGDGRRVTLPRRTRNLTVTVDAPAGRTMTALRVDNRTVLRDPAGLDGTYHVRVSQYETATVEAVGSGPLPAGSVVLTAYPFTARKATLEVTVDAA
ncbi:DUF7263 family protein [Halocalculus aciditolerans]|uniref:Uncharacterized protein n=1 Tax=Halocalculus aciditolerans TaxID=1383812 RepID=A0A830FJT1_9EURY|nr:hypothetical protein [Halocalculus aciditolerans]GGL63430.1 hypothetical protein GCM10009039_21670 [Halocalculus aciditolerans]